jgi:hypothetical protein
LIDAIRVMAGLVVRTGHPRRDMARQAQNSNDLVCSRARYILIPALRAPAWMDGTSPAMTEPAFF